MTDAPLIDPSAEIDKLIPPLPNAVLNSFVTWTPSGYKSLGVSNWHLLILRLLWSGAVSSGGAAFDYDRLATALVDATKTARKTYMPLGQRLVGTTWTSPGATQSITIFNKGTANGAMIVGSQTLTIEPGETHSWSAPEDNILSVVQIDATGTTLIVDYLVEA